MKFTIGQLSLIRFSISRKDSQFTSSKFYVHFWMLPAGRKSGHLIRLLFNYLPCESAESIESDPIDLTVERTNRKPPNTQYRISAFRRIQPNATHGPSQPLGTSDIQGIAKGRRRMPDSPESAGFFDATKNTQVKTAVADNRNNPAASTPPRENLSASVIVLPNQWSQTRLILFFHLHRLHPEFSVEVS